MKKNNKINKNGVNIKEVSKYVKTWTNYMPKDITSEDVISFKRQHEEASMGGLLSMMISIDVTFPGCYIASRLRASGKVPEDDIQNLLFTLGRQAVSDQKGHWKRCMQAYKKYKK